MDYFETAYQRDYISRETNKTKIIQPIDTLTFGPPKIEVEASTYLNTTFSKEHPDLYGKYFNEPLDNNQWEGTANALKKSTYSQDYDKEVDDTKKLKKVQVTLPKDTCVPETNYKSQFRDPASLFKIDYPKPIEIPVPALTQTSRLQTKVRMPEIVTEYHRHYNRTGNDIIEHQMLLRN